MFASYVAPILSGALSKFKEIVKKYPPSGDKRLVVFCEDRLSLAAERAVCEAVGGTFSTSVYTLSRFLSAEAGRQENVLTSQGSAMVLRKLIEANADKLTLFRRLSSTNAAQEVYDTIALLYSSGISYEDLEGVTSESELLNRKLRDVALLYREYSNYLKESGEEDRNAYLRRLPQVIKKSSLIKGADVVFLGFQAFTSSVAECVRACMRTADNVFGVFIGGGEKLYVNEGWNAFEGLASEEGQKGKITHFLPSSLCAQAEHMRRGIFDPEIFYADKLWAGSPRTKVGFDGVAMDICRGEVNIAEAADEEEECAYIAANVVKCVRERGVRYREISVMLPDLGAYQPVLERVFGEYGLPYYVDRRYPLASHPVCSFVLSFLSCASDGCRPESVLAAVGSPCFAEIGANKGDLRADRDIFVNYILRAASYRGGVYREPSPAVLSEPGMDAGAVERARSSFVKGVKTVPYKADGAAFCDAVRSLLADFGVEERLRELSEDGALSPFPSVAAMSARAYRATMQVVDEAEKLTRGERMTVGEFAKILKSGFAAAEVSLIPPKQDAVFVGDLSATANTGSKIIFVAGLTDAVPAASQDTSVLTDGELTSLEKLKLAVSPKISQVNRRVMEVTALNLCAFSQALYLVYPLRSGGEESVKSEVIAYARRLFTVGGKPMEPVRVKSQATERESIKYYCCRPAPALRRIAEYYGGSDDFSTSEISAVYGALRGWSQYCGDENYAYALSEVTGGDKGKKSITCGKLLYGNSVSPTALETYFSCPYKSFMERGLKLEERREGAFRPLDSGNFIHAVLQDAAAIAGEVGSEEEFENRVRAIAEEKLRDGKYAVSSDDRGAKYTANALVSEAVAVSLGNYRQIINSNFKVDSAECVCSVRLDGVTIGGRIDRVDKCGDMVRIIDYKTGSVDDSASSYYMGLKLQLPLYLSAVSEGGRPAGAYYFLANNEYSAEGGDFCLKGFMDGSEDVVKNSDVTVQEKQKSAYVGAYLNGRKLDKAMSKEDFSDFLSYSLLIAEEGAKGLIGGILTPSPAEGVCDYCKFAGCCGYDRREKGTRRGKKADCGTIAKIARERRENGGEQ